MMCEKNAEADSGKSNAGSQCLSVEVPPGLLLQPSAEDLRSRFIRKFGGTPNKSHIVRQKALVDTDVFMEDDQTEFVLCG